MEFELGTWTCDALAPQLVTGDTFEKSLHSLLN